MVARASSRMPEDHADPPLLEEGQDLLAPQAQVVFTVGLVEELRDLVRARPLWTTASQSRLGPEFLPVMTSTLSPETSSESRGTIRSLTLAPIVRWPTSVWTW